MVSKEDIQELKKMLEELTKLEKPENYDSGFWYLKANDVAIFITNRASLCDAISENIWHYLSDADIRIKEPEYAAMQFQHLDAAIVELENSQT